MAHDAATSAKTFAATHAVQLSAKQHQAFVAALTRLLADTYNKGREEAFEPPPPRWGRLI